MTINPTRRSALSALILGAAATLKPRPGRAGTADKPAPKAAPADEPQGTCTLTPQAVEGPFYFDPKLVRTDIAEDRPGAIIQLALRVIESGPCTPIPSARVDVWHADAGGAYSGYDGQGADGASTERQTFLRGTQMTDADGRVTFRTVYPGWYPGRTPHIHIKVFLDDKTLVTGQIYFPDDLSAKIYATREPYKSRGAADMTNGRDFLFREGEREGGGIVMTVADAGEPMVASLRIAVDRSGKAARGGGWRRLLPR